jgi:hypothetical protein
MKKTTTYLWLFLLSALTMLISCITLSNKQADTKQSFKRADNINISDTSDVNGKLILRDSNVITEPSIYKNSHRSHSAHSSHYSSR